MDLARFLIGSSRRMVAGTVLTSILAGIFGAALIAVIHRALVDRSVSIGLLITLFALVAAAKITTQCASQLMLARFAQDTILKLTRSLCDKLLASSYAAVEDLGAPRILAVLSEDVTALTSAMQALPTAATNLAVIAGCGIYLAWLSWRMLLASMLLIVIGAIGYRLLLRRSHLAVQAARESRDRLFENFRTLTDGLKELKLNAARREAFVEEELSQTTAALRSTSLEATKQYTIADAWSQLLFLVLIAALLFAAPAFAGLPARSITGYIFAALYIMTPVWAVIGAVPIFMRGRVALAHIKKLDVTLSGQRADSLPRRHPAGRSVSITFEQVTYAYPVARGGEPGFRLGPLNLTLASGEIVFVTGGNGSGKSTLAKLLTGLYSPHSGLIRLNGQLVGEATRESYRQNFAAVFADFHLFQRLFGIDSNTRAAEVQDYLALLHMERKVSVHNGYFSTTALSSGQRRRLALLTAYLEDRPVYVFDEWAADQDPLYKEIFYTRLLPQLKVRGKCVVVITHDERYFSLGDRLIKLEAGHAEPEHAEAVEPPRSVAYLMQDAGAVSAETDSTPESWEAPRWAVRNS
jgi:putative ATP-binding cassette transporter